MAIGGVHDAAGGGQVRIQLSTQHHDLRLPQDTGSVLVPTRLTRHDLATLVNDLLAPSTRVALDFFVDGSPLRTSLDQWILAHRASTEATLSVEYSRARPPPQHHASFPHHDCVGAVDVLSSASPSGDPRILSASFDGSVRVWSASSAIPLAASDGAVSLDEFGNRALADARLPFLHAAKFLAADQVVASGWPMYLRLWDYHEGPGDRATLTANSARLQPSLDLHAHSMPVNCIAVHAPSRRILSASDDGTARLWTADKDAAPPADPSHLPAGPSVKRRKLSSSSHAPVSARGPLATLSSHTSAVKSTIFHPRDPTVAYTASSDATLLTWDLETSRAVSSRTPGGLQVPLRSLCALPELGLLAAGTVDRRVLLVDPRQGAVRSHVGALRGHRNVVSALDAEPGGAYGLASGSFDGCVRIWDVRVAKDAPAGAQGRAGNGSTYKIPRAGTGDKCDRIEGGQGVKVLGLRWDGNLGIVSAGEDKKVQIDRVKPSS